jgi:hypothetical protein
MRAKLAHVRATLKLVWLILSGEITYLLSSSPELDFKMALTRFNAAVAALNTTADTFIAACVDHTSEIDAANAAAATAAAERDAALAALEQADADAAAAVQAVTDKLTCCDAGSRGNADDPDAACGRLGQR